MTLYLLRNCKLQSGITMTAADALRLRDSTGRRKCRDLFFCPMCAGNLVVHNTNPPHFEHARSTADRPQPDCSFRFAPPRN